MAETVGAIAAVVGLVDVVIRTFGHVKGAVHASKELDDTVDRILDICRNVQRIAGQNKTVNFPRTVFSCVEENLTLVCKIAGKCEKVTLRDRVKYMPKSLSRLGKLEKVEHQMQTVLALITVIIAEKACENTELTVVQLEEQKHGLTQMLRRIDDTSKQIDNAICDVTTLCGPLTNLALDDKVDSLLCQRFDRLDDSVADLQGNMRTVLNKALPTIQGIVEDTRDTVTRCFVPDESALQDRWVCNFSSVPALSSYFMQTQYIRNLKNVLLDETGQNRLVTVHGWGGAGKTTACKMLANDDSVRQRFSDGIIWIELGETASSGALTERLAHAVKISGGEKIAELIIRQVNADKFDLAKAEFQSWFDNRKILFVLDNIWESNDGTFNRWIEVLREIPGSKSSLLCSSRTPLGEKNVECSQLNAEEQIPLFLKHLQLRQDSNEYQDNLEFAQKIVGDCSGLPLALAMAAAYLRRDRNGWQSLSDKLKNEISVEGKNMFRIPQHAGLSSVFQTSIQWLDRKMAHPQNCSWSWTALYTSLCVIDPASPGLPLCVLSLMWGLCADSAQEVCQTFVSLSLATLSPGDADNRMVKLHDLQLQYCRQQCARDLTPLSNSAGYLVSESTWHARIIEVLLANAGAAVPIALYDSTNGECGTASAGLQAAAAKVDAVVESFLGLAEDSTLEEYYLKNLVRHICGCEGEAFIVLATGFLSDYRWLLAVCSRQSLSFAARQYYAVASSMRARRESNARSVKADELATDFGLGFARDLENIAGILRNFVDIKAVVLSGNVEKEACPVHGKRSVGDPGLAHQLVGRLGLVTSEHSSLVLEAGGENGDGSDGSGGYSLVEELVGSTKRCAVAPWLIPVNRWYFEADCGDLALVIRGAWSSSRSFILGNVECLASRGRKGIYVYELESGDIVRELGDDGSGGLCMFLTVAGEGCGVKPNDKEDIGLEKFVWLAAGRCDGSVHIWDLETERCVTTLHTMINDPQYSIPDGVSIAPDCSRVVLFKNPGSSGELHVWDLSSDGTLEGYAHVHGCRSHFEFELASAALLYQDHPKRRSIEQSSSRAVRFERRLESNVNKDVYMYSDTDSRGESPLGSVMSSNGNRFSESTDYVLVMSVEDAFVVRELEDTYRMRSCRVVNCKNRALVAAVNNNTGDVAVLDALTCEVTHKFRVHETVSSVAAIRREDGHVLVVTGDEDGKIRMRQANSGELIGRWRAMRERVEGVSIAVRADKVMGVYQNSNLWIWSLGDFKSGPHSCNPTLANPLPPSGGEEAVNNISNHSCRVSSIAFSGDGKVAASCSSSEKFVLVWDTASGTVLRKLEVGESDSIRLLNVALSSNGDWIICASYTLGRGAETTDLNLWGPSNHQFSASIARENFTTICSVTIRPSTQDWLRGEIRFGDEEDGFETYEWALSGSSEPKIVITSTTAFEEAVFDCNQSDQGGLEELLYIRYAFKLHVWNAALDRVDCCSCEAAAAFDSPISCESSWSETSVQPGHRPTSTSPKVAVGLWDGTVHFMQVCWNNDD